MGGVAVCDEDAAGGGHGDVARMVERLQRPAPHPQPADALAGGRADDDLMHVAVDHEEPPVGSDRQQMRVGDHRTAPAAEMRAVGPELDDARIVGLGQRIVAQADEDMPARVDGDIRHEPLVPGPGAEGALDAVAPVAQGDDQLMQSRHQAPPWNGWVASQ